MYARRRKGKTRSSKAAEPGGLTTTYGTEGFKRDGANSLDTAPPPFVNGDGDDLGSGAVANDVAGELLQQQKICSSSAAVPDNVNGGHKTWQTLDSKKSGTHHSSRSPESIVNIASSEAWADDDVITACNVYKAIERVTALKEDARIIAAAKLARRVEEFAENTLASTKESGLDARALHSSLEDAFSDLYVEDREFSSVLEGYSASDNWEYSHTFRGVMTHYKREKNLLWLKLCGDLEGAMVFDQLVTIREADLYDTWFPMCTESKLLKCLGNAEIVMHFALSCLGISRDAVVHATACDATIENNCILIKGKSVDQWESVDIPPEPKGLFFKRMVIHAFNSVFEFKGHSSVRTSLVICADPKAQLPHNITNYVIRNIGSVILYSMFEAASRISADPDDLHRDYVWQDETFYKNWIIPKIKHICYLRDWQYEAPTYLLKDACSDVSDKEEAKAGGPPEESSTALSAKQQTDVKTSSTTGSSKKKRRWRHRIKRKLSSAATKMKMRRKSRVKEEANSNFSSNHLIKEDSPRDDDPSPTGKKTRVRSVDHGSLHASDVAASTEEGVVRGLGYGIGVSFLVLICTVPLFGQWHMLSTPESKWKSAAAVVAEGILRFGIAQFMWQLQASAAWSVIQSPPRRKHYYTRAFMMHYIRFAEVGWSVLLWFVSLFVHGILCIILGMGLCAPTNWIHFTSRVDATLLMTSSTILLLLSAFQLATA